MSKLIREGFAAWRECRTAYDELLHAQYQLAEDRTHGAMLNERGRQAGIDPWRLFTSNLTYRNAYASRELQDHWRDHPHTTFAAFEKQYGEEPGPKVVEGRCKHCFAPIVYRDDEEGVGTVWIHKNGYYGCINLDGSLSLKLFAEIDDREPAVNLDHLEELF